MRRIHAPELEDEQWFPAVLRDSITAFLHAQAEKLGTFREVRTILRGVLERHRMNSVVDLCSGGGGPLISLLDEMKDVRATLTDLYPNHAAFDRAEARLAGRAQGHRESIDATSVPAPLDGVRTIFNAFHHFRPKDARNMLLDAAQNRKPICVFEFVGRDLLTLALIATTPLAVLALTPWTRPSLARLALTYLLPIVPLATLWDGIASCMRAYSLAELKEMTDSIDVEGYRFTMGSAERAGGPFRITWVVGEPAT